MDLIIKLMQNVADFMWGWPLLVLLLGTHVFLTIRLKGIQRHLWKAIKLSVTKDPDSDGHISQFSALTTSLAATVGTGNIIGVATAVTMGGPGAVFWIFLTGLLGIATKYAEGLLSIKYRVKTKSGGFAGGPMYVLEYGLKNKPLGIAFAIFTAIAALACGSSIQANSITGAINSSFGVSPWVTAIFVMTLSGTVIFGGLKSIAKISDSLVPFMAIFYVAGCFWILGVNYQNIIPSIGLIINQAFSLDATVGGLAGSTIMMIAARFGVARGLMSNESGLGSAPILAAAAQTRNPVRQALVSSTATFWDTVVICTLTGIVLVSSGAYNTGLKGIEVTQAAFSAIPFGNYFLTISILIFTFTTILGWSYYPEKAVEYIWGHKAIIYYRAIYIAFLFIGGTMQLDLVWSFGDVANGLMAIPNLISLVLLSGVIVAETRKYLWDDKLHHHSEDEMRQHHK